MNNYHGVVMVLINKNVMVFFFILICLLDIVSASSVTQGTFKSYKKFEFIDLDGNLQHVDSGKYKNVLASIKDNQIRSLSFFQVSNDKTLLDNLKIELPKNIELPQMYGNGEGILTLKAKEINQPFDLVITTKSSYHESKPSRISCKTCDRAVMNDQGEIICLSSGDYFKYDQYKVKEKLLLDITMLVPETDEKISFYRGKQKYTGYYQSPTPPHNCD